MKKRRPLFAKYLLVFSIMMLVILTGCAPLQEKDSGIGPENTSIPDDGAPEGVRVVTTIFPLADIVHNLGAGKVEVTALLPPGTSPHTYEPTVEQVKAVARADLFVLVGGGLDDWVTGLAEAQQVPLLEIMEHLGSRVLAYNTLPLDENHENGAADHNSHHEEEAHYHHHGSRDPHFWTDPVLVKEVVAPLITEKFKAINPANEGYFEQSLKDFQTELELLDEEIKNTVGQFSKKQFISYHSAWNYFAHRYGLEEVATVEAFPGKEPSAKWLAELVRLAGHYQIDILFAEPQLSKSAAEVIAGELGGRVLILDPLGGKGVPGRESYTELIRYNLQIFRQALQ